MTLTCGCCKHTGQTLEFAYVPYPAPGEPKLKDYTSRFKCPECGSEDVEKS